METHWFSSEEKVPVTMVTKEGHADSLLGHERIHHNSFSWKSATVNKCFLLPTKFKRNIEKPSNIQEVLTRMHKYIPTDKMNQYCSMDPQCIWYKTIKSLT